MWSPREPGRYVVNYTWYHCRFSLVGKYRQPDIDFYLFGFQWVSELQERSRFGEFIGHSHKRLLALLRCSRKAALVVEPGSSPMQGRSQKACGARLQRGYCWSSLAGG